MWRPSTRSRASPTTSPTKAPRRRPSGRRSSTPGSGGCTRAVAVERSADAPHEHEDLIVVALGHSIRSLDLPVALFDDLLSAFGQDTMTTRYASWADVLDYCRRSANPVGRLVLRIAGYRDEALDRSSDALCTALQLTNFWQDFGRDWRAGRLYVPRESPAPCGAREAELDGGALTAGVDARRSTRCVAVTRELFRGGRAVCDGVARPAAARAALHLARRRAHSRARRAHRADLLDRPADARRRATCRVLLWRAARWTARGLMARKTSFYYSFLVLPPEQRRAIIAVWDFCRAVDDAVDEAPACAGRRALPAGRERGRVLARRSWRAATTAATPRPPQGRRLQPFVAQFDLPRQAFEDVIDGVAMDLDTTRYETFDELFEYCRRVASAVGHDLHPDLRLPERAARASTR